MMFAINAVRAGLNRSRHRDYWVPLHIDAFISGRRSLDEELTWRAPGDLLRNVGLTFRPESELPVLGSVVLVVDADGVLDDDWVPAAEVVVEPLRIGWAQIGAPVADVALPLSLD